MQQDKILFIIPINKNQPSLKIKINRIKFEKNFKFIFYINNFFLT